MDPEYQTIVDFLIRQQYERAIRYIEERIKAITHHYSPNSTADLGQLYYFHAKAHYLAAHHREAFASIKASLECETTVDNTSFYGHMLLDFDAPRDALVQFLKSEELGRNDEWLYNSLATVYGLLERPKEALVYLKKSRAIDDSDPWLDLQEGYMDNALGQYQHALEMFFRYLEKSGEINDAFVYGIGYSNYHLGDLTQSLNWLSRLDLIEQSHYAFSILSLKLRIYHDQERDDDIIRTLASLSSVENLCAFLDVIDTVYYVELFIQALNLYPVASDEQKVVQHLNLALAHQYIRQREACVSLLDSIAPLVDNTSFHYLTLGIRYGDVFQHEKALSILNDCHDLCVDSKEQLMLFRGLSWNYSKINEHNLALQYCQKVLTLAPSEAGSYLELAVVLSALGRHQEALDSNLKALDLGEDSFRGYNNTGWSYQQLEQFDKAIEWYMKALTFEKNLDDLYSELGFCHMRRHEYASAFHYFRCCLDSQPRQYIHDNVLGYLEMLLDQFASVIEDHVECLTLYEDVAELCFRLDLYQYGVTVVGFAFYHEGVDTYRMLVLLGYFYNKLGEFEKAYNVHCALLEAYRKEDFGDDYPFVMLNFGVSQAYCADRESACASFQNALDCVSEHQRHSFVQAVIDCYQSRQWEGAYSDLPDLKKASARASEA
ncbi:hypothetical protein VIBNISFn27_p10047 [Vibrio nigripulchritudo SFn27]|uniref:TPR repeat protein n=1 Tax=Vibrio nigripulchritudo TaxID=28173 RepID=A0A9P1JL93_9VIBR|nr:tetratricopeptide repeat protein [Vibrio nigripulchritudo]CBJ93090.1 Protein of unknown function with TPR repeat [Vibrio nigripulchritudo]CCN38637.1 hypothetical protein VIBNIAM115_p0039 [Vibrio nigripulchritudo AM115]CCN44946.1 hypothetical protein VIBNIFTn2_p0038 [Vibrio nigripulchritudo FTn2]CCN79701.1 hypothetical protein VIBNISO65_p0038 [Vibrio nigripulchritudo SO65]CCN85906.1 hypothetical protein VIBNIBLFn1_p0043 [Vibrio nigripulchritudo BLFn1]